MNNISNQEKVFNIIAQFALPGLTIGAQVATSLKYPQFGLIINLLAQPFWLYSSWKAYKQAGQVGILITTIIFTIITTMGIINYWYL
ncbi:MAG: hypothetical protein US81_C0028G0006 [Parcubacteria group bacterium GW2011_GWE2_38_18]|nr:MAG: hypothetical protein US81_C0028G0006 [Parcubacteria group bacterium GW2011_GWE2_38_18]